MPLLAAPPPAGQAPGAKRRLAAIAAAVALVLAAVAVWSAVHPDAYSRSRAGCVSVTIASSTGGALLRVCGPAARVMCRHALVRHDRLSLVLRPACRQAGLD